MRSLIKNSLAGIALATGLAVGTVGATMPAEAAFHHGGGGFHGGGFHGGGFHGGGFHRGGFRHGFGGRGFGGWGGGYAYGGYPYYGGYYGCGFNPLWVLNPWYMCY